MPSQSSSSVPQVAKASLRIANRARRGPRLIPAAEGLAEQVLETETVAKAFLADLQWPDDFGSMPSVSDLRSTLESPRQSLETATTVAAAEDEIGHLGGSRVRYGTLGNAPADRIARAKSLLRAGNIREAVKELDEALRLARDGHGSGVTRILALAGVVALGLFGTVLIRRRTPRLSQR
jgi:hypothetical protein